MKVVRVFKIEELEGKGKKIGECSIEFDNGVTIHGWGIVQGKNGMFVASPSKSAGRKPDGNWNYINVVEVPRGLQEEINAEVLRAAGLEVPNAG